MINVFIFYHIVPSMKITQSLIVHKFQIHFWGTKRGIYDKNVL